MRNFDEQKWGISVSTVNVAARVRVGVESGWAAASTAATLPGCGLVALVGDYGLDAASAQLGADDPGRVGPIRDDRIGTGPRSAWTVAGNVDLGEDFGEHGAVVALPASDDHRERAAVSVDGLMDLRGQPAAGAADAVSGWFNLVPGQILVIRSRPLCPAPGESCSSRADAHA